MQYDLSALASAPLFENIRTDDLGKLLQCLGAQVKTYPKGGVVLLAGEPTENVGLVLRGAAQISQETRTGAVNMLGRVEPGELFAEVFACLGAAPSPVTVVAETEFEALFIHFKRILTTCPSSCAFHARLVENLLRLLAQKTLALNEKLSCIGHRTLREKVEAFLELWQKRAGHNPFCIPFSRAQMADYLCVDRSALSSMLGRLRDEGCLRYHKNRFELLDGFGG